MFALVTVAALLAWLCVGQVDAWNPEIEEIKASQFTDVRERLPLLLADVVHPPTTKVQQTEDTYEFHLKPGYFSASLPQLATATRIYTKEMSFDLVDSCHEDFRTLSAVHLVGNRFHRIFAANRLLSLLKNRQIAFVGDAFTRRFYLELAAELRPVQSWLQYGALPTVKTLITDAKYTATRHEKSTWVRSSVSSEELIEASEKQDFMRRYFAQFNVTLLWCHDPLLDHFSQYNIDSKQSTVMSSSFPSHCDFSALLDSNVLVLGVGMGLESNLSVKASSSAEYALQLTEKLQSLRTAMQTYRALFRAHNRFSAAGQSHVLWSLMPHVGNVQMLPKTIAAEKDGKFWSNATMGSPYPVLLNKVTRQVAEENRDEYLDIYRLSMYYLLHFSHHFPLPLPLHNRIPDRSLSSVKVSSGNLPQYRVHSNAWQYCPGSVYRGALFLVQAAIEHRLEAQRRRERRHHQQQQSPYESVGEPNPSSKREREPAVWDLSLEDLDFVAIAEANTRMH
jgi:hypothetical protein